MENQKTLQTQTSSHLPTLEVKASKIYEAFKICALCDNRFSYTPDQLTYWSDRIVSKYPKLTTKEFEKIIQDGTEGKFRGENFSTHICLATVFEWINAGAKQPDIDYHSFYGTQSTIGKL